MLTLKGTIKNQFELMKELEVYSFGPLLNILQLSIHPFPFPIFIGLVVSIVLIKADNKLHLLVPFFVEDWINELEGGVVNFDETNEVLPNQGDLLLLFLLDHLLLLFCHNFYLPL